MLVRAHVRRNAPMPIAELNVLKVAIAQLSAIGRDLQELPHGGIVAPDDGAVMRLLQEAAAQVESVRRQAAAVVRANLMSWEARFLKLS